MAYEKVLGVDFCILLKTLKWMSWLLIFQYENQVQKFLSRIHFITLLWIQIMLCWSNTSKLYYSTVMKPPTYLKSLNFLHYHFMWEFSTLFFGIELYQILQVILDLLLTGHYTCLLLDLCSSLMYLGCLCILIMLCGRWALSLFPGCHIFSNKKMGLKWLLLFPN